MGFNLAFVPNLAIVHSFGLIFRTKGYLCTQFSNSDWSKADNFSVTDVPHAVFSDFITPCAWFVGENYNKDPKKSFKCGLYN